MKRIVALTLVLLTAFVLCAYGSNSDTQEANLESALEVDSEQQKQDEERLHQEEEQNKKVYEQATSYLEQGDLYHAAITFYSIADYADAREKCFETWHRITGYRTIDVAPQSSNGLCFAIKENGTLYIYEPYGHSYENLEAAYSWDHLVSVAVGDNNIWGLKDDGTVVGTHYDGSKLYDIVAIYAGAGYDKLFLRADGIALTSPSDTSLVTPWEPVPLSFDEGVIAVTGRDDYKEYFLGLKPEGTLVGYGQNDDGQLNIRGRENITALTSWYNTVMCLKKDGTVEIFGDEYADVSGWDDIISVCLSVSCAYGLRNDGTVEVAPTDFPYGEIPIQDIKEWHDITELAANQGDLIGLKSDGTMCCIDGKYNEYQKKALSTWTGIRQPNVYKNAYSSERTDGEKWQQEFESLLHHVYGRSVERNEDKSTTENGVDKRSYAASGYYDSYIHLDSAVPTDAKEVSLDIWFFVDSNGAELYKYGTFAGVDDNIDNLKAIPEGSRAVILNLWRIGKIMSALAGEAVPSNGNIDVLLNSRDDPQKVGDWEYTSQLSESGTYVQIHAVYKGPESSIISSHLAESHMEADNDINSRIEAFLKKESSAVLQDVLDGVNSFQKSQDDAFSYVDNWG